MQLIFLILGCFILGTQAQNLDDNLITKSTGNQRNYIGYLVVPMNRYQLQELNTFRENNNDFYIRTGRLAVSEQVEILVPEDAEDAFLEDMRTSRLQPRVIHGLVEMRMYDKPVNVQYNLERSVINKLTDFYDYPNPINIFALKSDAPTTTKNTIPPMEDLRYYVYFCAAAYSIFSENDTWTCPGCKLTGPDVTLEKIVMHDLRNLLALYNVNKVRREIIVTYRGSINLQNFIQDSALIPVRINIPGAKGDLRVHLGFRHAAESLIIPTEAILRRLVTQYPGFKIVFTGHSLGAAIAAVSGVMIRAKPQFSNLPFAIITYGQPRTGNKAFADHVNSLGIQNARVVNRADVVAHIPIRFLQSDYIHSQNEVWIAPTRQPRTCSRSVYEDPECSNSLGPVFFNALDHTSGYFDTNFNLDVADNICPFLAQLLFNVPGVVGIDPCNMINTIRRN